MYCSTSKYIGLRKVTRWRHKYLSQHNTRNNEPDSLWVSERYWVHLKLFNSPLEWHHIPMLLKWAALGLRTSWLAESEAGNKESDGASAFARGLKCIRCTCTEMRCPFLIQGTLLNSHVGMTLRYYELLWGLKCIRCTCTETRCISELGFTVPHIRVADSSKSGRC